MNVHLQQASESTKSNQEGERKLTQLRERVNNVQIEYSLWVARVCESMQSKSTERGLAVKPIRPQRRNYWINNLFTLCIVVFENPLSRKLVSQPISPY